MNPTLDDVAAHAGVSTATVSRFFNTPGVVAETTAKRIREAVAATGYIPNMLAGGLASNKSRLVAVLIPQLGPSIFNDTMEAMVNEFSASGSIVMLGLTELDTDRTDDLIMAALGRRAEAIVITGDVRDKTRALLRRSKTSVIEIWDLPEDPIDVAIGFSHYEIGKDIARFLRGRGYIRPHFIATRGARALRRRDGFKEEWEAQGGGLLTEDSLELPLRFGNARSAFANIRRLNPLPDVIVCGSDWLAQGLIIEAQAAGLNVPGDIAVIGFGNSALAGEMRPTITSIDIDGARIARESIALLRKREKGEPVTENRIDVGFRLIARESA
ncbi:LacI family DNA-binding transcriptional regulator [Emcibacter sp.]|uniref:LacI family DNA-binding transcriptional regulator n=1 Tax=Emcibacter sp. TaxID=1979954 RepID=UPI002AA79D14|nr:LacI family DNA-binding transcriptional regulator [Emcibacter sp.]